MAERVPGDQVFCHECEYQWPRSEHGLTCPRCHSEFVEILETTEHDEDDDTPEIQQYQPFPPNIFSNFNNFLPTRQTYHAESGNGHITRHHYQSNDGRFQFTSTTIRSPSSGGLGGGIRLGMSSNPRYGSGADDSLSPIFRSFNAILQGIAETQPNRGGIPAGYGYQSPNPQQSNNYRDTDPPEILGGGLHPRDATRPQGNPQPLLNINDILAIMHGTANPNYRGGGIPIVSPIAAIAQALGMQHHGDAVYSQEELDRVISQLVDQNMNGNAPAPASADAIRALPKVKIDKSMLGSDGKAECSICMDSVEVGTEVAMLPCKHWFHDTCITAWLNEHDTCPHCRQGIMATYQQANGGAQQQSQPPLNSTAGPPGSSRNPYIVPSSPSTEQPSSIPNISREGNQSSGQTGSISQNPNTGNNNTQQPSGIAGWMRYHFGGGSSS
ncbi:putative RING-type E3 ubiquitin transferase [Microsporum ferrugineum]